MERGGKVCDVGHGPFVSGVGEGMPIDLGGRRLQKDKLVAPPWVHSAFDWESHHVARGLTGWRRALFDVNQNGASGCNQSAARRFLKHLRACDVADAVKTVDHLIEQIK